MYKLDGAVFYNEMKMEAMPSNRRKITQCLSLKGKKAANFVEGIKMFETSAPQGLSKLAEAIELGHKKTLK
ncbi:hypothetical protein [Flagellimonas sp. 2504JD4-2]